MQPGTEIGKITRKLFTGFSKTFDFTNVQLSPRSGLSWQTIGLTIGAEKEQQ